MWKNDNPLIKKKENNNAAFCFIMADIILI